MRDRPKKDSGFTLIEVIAALMIFSVGIVGLISLNTQSIRTINILEDQFVAGVIADNLLVDSRRAERLELGETSGEEESMGRTFTWQQDVQNTEQENFFRINVRVLDENGEQLLIERVAYRLGRTNNAASPQ